MAPAKLRTAGDCRLPAGDIAQPRKLNQSCKDAQSISIASLVKILSSNCFRENKGLASSFHSVNDEVR